MAIEYQTTSNAAWRTTPKDDLIDVPAETVTLRLNPTPVTYQWYMLGRPEQSDAGSLGSAGPDFLPVDMGVGAEPTFIVTADNEAADILTSGTHIIQCIADQGTVNEAVHRIALSRLADEGGLIYSPRNAAYEAFRLPGHKEIAGDGDNDLVDDWSFALERLFKAAFQLRDFRCGVHLNAASPQAIAWAQPFINTSYIPIVFSVMSGVIVTDFQATAYVANTTIQFTVTFNGATAGQIDLYWAAILVKDA